MTENFYKFDIGKVPLQQAHAQSFNAKIMFGYPLALKPGGEPLLGENDVQIGYTVYVADPFSKGRWWSFVVGNDRSYASNDSMGCSIGFSADERHCWLATMFFQLPPATIEEKKDE